MRLTKSEKEFLTRKVKETVFDDIAQQRWLKTEQECIDDFLAWYDIAYPPKDRAVLKKYNYTSPSKVVRIYGSDPYVTTILQLTTAVDLPDGYHTKLCPTTKDKTKFIADVYTPALDQAKKANEAARQKYYNILQSCNSWKELLSVWPEAKIYQPTPNTAVIPVNSQTIAEVKRDSKKRDWKK